MEVEERLRRIQERQQRAATHVIRASRVVRVLKKAAHYLTTPKGRNVPQEVADICGCKLSTVYNWLHDTSLPKGRYIELLEHHSFALLRDLHTVLTDELEAVNKMLENEE